MAMRHCRRFSALGMAAGWTAIQIALLVAALPALAQDVPANAEAAKEPEKPEARLMPLTVQKPDGSPLADSEVSCWRFVDSGGFLQETLQTDGRGQCRMEIGETKWLMLSLYAEGIGWQRTEKIVLNDSAPPPAQTVRLKAGGQVFGQVVDKVTGQPVTGAYLRFTVQPFGGTPSLYTLASPFHAMPRSDDEGWFYLSGLPEGKLLLWASHKGHEDQMLPVTVAVGQITTDVEFELQPRASLSCRLLRPDGKPLANTQVSVTTFSYGSEEPAFADEWDKPAEAFAEQTTDADGHLTVSNLAYAKTVLVLLVKDVGYAKTELLALERDKPVAPLTLTVNSGLTLSGTAVGKQSGKPIPGVKIDMLYNVSMPDGGQVGSQLNVGEVTSDAQGRWRIRHLPPGEYSLSGQHEGYGDLWEEVSLVEGENPAEMKLELVEPVTVTGVVVTAEGGTPVAKAVVALNDQKTLTDDRGRFSLKVNPYEGEAQVLVEAEGLANHMQILAFADYRAPAPLRIEMTPGSTISGMVINVDTGRPVANQSVAIVNLTTCEYALDPIQNGRLHELDPGNYLQIGWQNGVYGTTTDAAGTYSITTAKAGKYVVIAFPEGTLPAPGQPFEVAAGAAADAPAIRVTARPIGYLSGRLLGPDGQPLDHIVVAADACHDNEPLDCPLILRGHRYYMPLTLAAVTRFRFAVRGYALVERTIQVPDLKVAVEEDLKFTPVKCDASISGRVLLSDGQTPAAGVRVELFVRDRPWPAEQFDGGLFSPGITNFASDSSFTLTGITTQTKPDGTYCLDGVPPGTYGVLSGVRDQGLVMRHQEPPSGKATLGYRAAAREGVAVAESAQVKDIHVTLRSAGAIAGRVVDAATGKPIAGANLSLYRTDADREETSQPSFWNSDDYSAATDEEGKYRLNGLPPGKYQLNVYAQGYHESSSSGFWGPKTLKVEAGQTTERTVRMRPGDE